VVPGADILVGVPCYKDGPMIERCLQSLIEPGVQILIVDNGSPADVKQVLHGRGIVIRNALNRYVNPAWNQMMQLFLAERRHDLLVLANSDLVLDPGWADKLRTQQRKVRSDQIIFGFDAPRGHATRGEFFALSRRAAAACCPIPDDLLVLGGDDFIFHVADGIGCEKHAVKELTLSHVIRGTYDKSPEVWRIGRCDTAAWFEHVLPALVPQRINQFLRDEAAT